MSRPFQQREFPTGIGHYILRTSVTPREVVGSDLTSSGPVNRKKDGTGEMPAPRAKSKERTCKLLSPHFSPAAGGSGTNSRRQECRGRIHRARVPTYCTLGDVHKLLPRAVASGPSASSAGAVVRNAR